jgi:hypothetical protein
MRSLPILGEQLHRVPNTLLGTASTIPNTLTRSTQIRSHCARERRGHHLRCDKVGASQRDSSAQLAALLHCYEQRRHTVGDCIREGHNHTCFLGAWRGKALPVPTRLHRRADIQHVLQFGLNAPLRIVRFRDRPHFPIGPAQQEP